MRLSQIHMSNGAWVFAGIATMILASTGVCPAANSTVAVGNPNGTTTALVTPTRQLETAVTASTNVVHVFGSVGPSSCPVFYTPPSGKAIVVTQITYDVGTGSPNTESWAELGSNGCNEIYDIGDTEQPFEAQSHTFPTGLPLPDIYINTGANSATQVIVAVTGYLIPATQLPAEPPENVRRRTWSPGVK